MPGPGAQTIHPVEGMLFAWQVSVAIQLPIVPVGNVAQINAGEVAVFVVQASVMKCLVPA